MRLRVRPRLVRVLFMRKEKHRSVGASGFFLDRPGEGHRKGVSRSPGSSGQGPVPYSAPPASFPELRPGAREGPPGEGKLLQTPQGRAVPPLPVFLSPVLQRRG